MFDEYQSEERTTKRKKKYIIETDTRFIKSKISNRHQNAS